MTPKHGAPDHRWKFSLKSLMALTTCVAFAIIGFQYWNGPTLEQRLWRAACAGDSQTFAWLVWFGADVGVSKGGYSPSPMQEAAYQGNLPAVRLYVQNGAYLDYMEKDSFTPINYAAMEAHWDIVEFLLQAGANPHLVDATGRSALNYAREAGQDRVVQLIRDLGPLDPNSSK
jgi:hypothetical protein